MDLPSVTLVSGDVNNDNLIDISDATAVGLSFDQTGSNLLSDINNDAIIDIFDLVLVGSNFGISGPQSWNCHN
ncbi:MAG: hypothetical protein H6633_24965 [Anaerolineales bacterium]|nr:hypothetical protein [Anaerolineales bacterium]